MIDPIIIEGKESYVIIVEGADGAGKTTLIQRLSDGLNWPVAPRVVAKNTRAMVDLKLWVQDNLAQGFQRMIFDRHRLISETIYGPILRFEAQPGFHDFAWLSAQMHLLYNRVRPIIIYCIPPIETVVGNVMFDEENAEVRDRITKIYNAYVARAAVDFAHGSVIIYDFTKRADETRIVDHVRDLLDWRRM